MINIRLKRFQEKAVDYLYEKTALPNKKNKKTILESPTGSGKTIILISYIEKYLSFIENTTFIWLSPGKGDLEEQSKEKMDMYSPMVNTGNIHDILQNGIKEKSAYFINWEMITNRNNRSISDSEKANLFDRIADAHKKGINFITIIDEEHSHNTAKADYIINAFAASHEIRVSATPVNRSQYNYYKIDEVDVINEELITKAMYVNRDIEDFNINTIEGETDYLIDKANSIRKEIKDSYLEENENINPLVLIQFPNLNDELIENVEEKLASLGYTYKNNLVASWFAEENQGDKQRKSKKLGKVNIGSTTEGDSITNNDAEPMFLLFKQALATGWDCPRAKVLVKLRENMNESFEIQTLGRLRRMPKARHYGKEILDCSFLFTFDEKYKMAVLKMGGYETERLFLKEEPKKLELIKEVRNKDKVYVDEKGLRDNLYEFILKKYELSKDYLDNKRILNNNGYVFGTEIHSKYFTARVRRLIDLQDNENLNEKARIYSVDTHIHGLDLRQKIDNFKKYIFIDYKTTRKILENLFKVNSGNNKYKILNLTLREFYAFILNNEPLIKELLKEFDARNVQTVIMEGEDYKSTSFKIPLDEHYRISHNIINKVELSTNAYKNYNTSMISDDLRSTSERLFEQYCESNKNINYVYKNGDKGQDYLSIVYRSGNGTVKSFYPDYIVTLKQGEIWIIETKGGEHQGISKNIDIYAETKFNEFKRYAKDHNYNFAFVRDSNNQLYYNNTFYTENMDSGNWASISDIF